MSELTKNQPKLVVVEGLPGSGKSTVTAHVNDSLRRLGYDTNMYLEGDLSHPAEFESVACIDVNTVREMVAYYPNIQNDIERFIDFQKGDAFVQYERAWRELEDALPLELYEWFKRFEVYDGIPVEKYSAVSVDRWASYANKQKMSAAVDVFECCFMQNPGCAILARHNAGSQFFEKHILSIADLIAPLNPVFIYLYPSNVRQTIDRAKQTRPKEWLNFVIWYHTQQEYGRAHRLSGYDGYIQFLETRRELEMNLLQKLPFQAHVVENVDYDWDRQRAHVSEILQAKFTK